MESLCYDPAFCDRIKDIYIPMLPPMSLSIFTTAMIWKGPKCPSKQTDEEGNVVNTYIRYN